MKKLIPLLLLPSVALAQPPEGAPAVAPEKAAPPSFEEVKVKMAPMIGQSLPAMKETRECVSKAESKEAVETCMNEMAKKAQEIQKQSGMEVTAKSQKMPENFKWDPETKAAMLAKMDHSIKQNSAMNECFGSSNTKEEMDSCMRSKIPMQKIQKRAP